MTRSTATGPFLLRLSFPIGDGAVALCPNELPKTWPEIYSPTEWAKIVSAVPMDASEIERRILLGAVTEGIIERRNSAEDYAYHRRVAENLLAATTYIVTFHDQTRDDLTEFGGPEDSSWVSQDWIRTEYETACFGLKPLQSRLERHIAIDDRRKEEARTKGKSRDSLPRRTFFRIIAQLWSDAGLAVNMSAAFIDFVNSVQVAFDPSTRLARATIIKYVRDWRAANGLPALRARS